MSFTSANRGAFFGAAAGQGDVRAITISFGKMKFNEILGWRMFSSSQWKSRLLARPHPQRHDSRDCRGFLQSRSAPFVLPEN
ncbi:MAG: hypothetical protein WD738_20550 [Pirellulales bacterium]